MPVIAIRDDALPDDAVPAEALGRLVPAAPVVVMIHGYRYSPACPSSDPHRHILALAPDGRHWGAVSWPRRLDLGGDRGLGLAWGWDARGSIWEAHRRALASGDALARVLAPLRAREPDRPVHLIAHSLGARVALSALTRLRPGDVQRVILLAAALSLQEARTACAAPAGREAEIINVVGRENHLFDLLLRLALPHHGKRLGSRGIDAQNWLDLQLDEAALLAGEHLRRPIRAARRRRSGRVRPSVRGHAIRLEQPARKYNAERRAHRLNGHERRGRSKAWGGGLRLAEATGLSRGVGPDRVAAHGGPGQDWVSG